jgi:uncharacterized protein (DUF2235 family)
MPKDMVICCDGTGNEINSNLSNVLKLFRVLVKDADQRVFYHPGVGTIGLQSTWRRLKQETYGVFSLATGAGLDEDILAAYRFLCTTYQSGDRVWLFGFSRGAYTVRVLAAFIHVIGLLPPDQIDLAGYALSVYKNASANGQGSDENARKFLDQAWEFRRVAGGYLIPIEFMGVWDTVASVIVPRQDKFLLDLQTLVYTRTNPSVKKFRQAMAIDERRRMFRLNRWVEPQKYRPDPFDASTAVTQDTRQVWFAGVHGDVGGGYPEVDSGLSKYPLLWMIAQAKAAGLRVDDSMVNHLGWGWPRAGSTHPYVKPDPTAKLHVSLTGAWWILEFLPKLEKYREWLKRKCFLGLYIPDAEPRPIPGAPLTPIPERPIIHRSVLDRMDSDPSYRPVNLPANYSIEEGPSPPVASAPPGAENLAGNPEQPALPGPNPALPG